MLATVTITIDLQAILVWALVGLVAGFLASRVMIGHGMGLLADIVVGILGAIAGTLLGDLFNVTINVAGHPIISQIIIAFIGAALLLGILRLVRGGGGRRRVR